MLPKSNEQLKRQSFEKRVLPVFTRTTPGDDGFRRTISIFEFNLHLIRLHRVTMFHEETTIHIPTTSLPSRVISGANVLITLHEDWTIHLNVNDGRNAIRKAPDEYVVLK
ncbi:hypothetical protein DPMN_034961 [Dreissena polymorpha]|uniref:Uncharacterized protein n=1 Tax=Dreissena polymorpha TaxID=45954 RepID=A0A9D4M7S3_DREPO|nr:hypothetical protein DPMN_034961 [Dreissena polymorpha]